MSSKLLNERIALITGSTRGIGWETAKLFAKEGAIVIINGHSDQGVIDAHSKELRERYGTPEIGICADFSDPIQIQNCYQRIFQRFKKIDIVVNNAGIMLDGLLGMIPEDVISRSFALNSVGIIHSIQCASRLMRRSGKGSIVNIASIMGIQGNVGQVVYSGTKASIIGITKASAKELAPYQIRVNCVAPGMIQTDLLNSISEEMKNATIANTSLRRIGQPEEVAQAILFLASDNASYITGQVLGVDGGMII